MRREYTCISCPRSCDLVLIDEDGDIRVSGNGCRRGEDYAKNVYLNPQTDDHNHRSAQKRRIPPDAGRLK